MFLKAECYVKSV